MSERVHGRQAQTIADQTKEFGQKMQKAAQAFTSNASNAMAEASRRTEEAVSTMTSRPNRLRKDSARRSEFRNRLSAVMAGFN
jgi:hypothetical protein